MHIGASDSAFDVDTVRLINICIILSLRFNGHFPGEPGLASVY